MPRKKRDAMPNVALYNLRDARSETQEQTAEALNVLAYNRGEITVITGNHVSRWERGIVHPSRFRCQLLAEHFGLNVTELGLTRQRMPATERVGTSDELLTFEDDRDMQDPEVAQARGPDAAGPGADDRITITINPCIRGRRAWVAR